MSTSVTIDSVVTEDITPTDSPFRVSKIVGKDLTTATFRADSSASHLYPGAALHPQSPTLRPSPIASTTRVVSPSIDCGRKLVPGPTLDPTNGPVPEPAAFVYGYRVRAGGTDSNTGTLLGTRGFCCGMTCDPDAPCDVFLTLSGSPYRTGSPMTSSFTASVLGAIADGAVQINVYAFTSSEGWNPSG